MIFILEIIGTIAFAVSGASTGIHYKMDLFGVATMGVTTAIGGGIVRDLIIGHTPPNAFTNPVYAITALVVSLIIFLPCIRNRIHPESKILFFMDAVGLGIFTVMGVLTGEAYGGIFLSVFLGTVTGVGGGVIRDIFADRRPLIFIKYFYACAAIIGALICTLLLPYGRGIAMTAGCVSIIVLRVLAAKYRWSLPK